MRVPDHVRHADVGARVLANVPDRLAEELERERRMGLVHVVDLRDDRHIRDPGRRAGHHHRRNAVVQHGTDLGGKAASSHSSGLLRRHQPGAGARTGRLQVDLEHFELDRQARLQDECFQQLFRRIGEKRPDALDEAVANAVDDFNVLALQRPVAEVTALELVGLVRRELFDRERELTVVLQRLDQAVGELLGNEGGQTASVGTDAPSGDTMAIGHEVPIARARKSNIGVLVQEADDLPWNHDGSPCPRIRSDASAAPGTSSSVIRTRAAVPRTDVLFQGLG